MFRLVDIQCMYFPFNVPYTYFAFKACIQYTILWTG